jgi:preprotein translocase subunit SecG
MSTISGFIPYLQILLAVLVIAGILLQQSDASVGQTFGGGDTMSSMHHTRRGFEKVVFNATIVFAVLFIISCFVALIS